jgi:predicted PurR-regulated permease PerM
MNDRSSAEQVELLVPVRTLLRVGLFGGFVVLVVVALDVLLSIFVAVVLAIGLDPVVGALVRRGWGRGRAALAVFAGLFVAVVLIVLITVGPLWDQVREFVAAIPQYWQEISSTDAFETFVSSGTQESVRSALEDLAKGLPEAASTLLGIAGGIFGSLLSLVTLTFLALFLLIERHAITESLFGFARPEAEDRWHPVLEESIGAVSSSLIGNLAISLVALTVSTPAAIAMAIIQIVYQQLENYVVYPIVYRRAVELSAFTTIVAVLIAGSLLGVVGAILAVPFAAVIKTVLREATAPRRERMAALRQVPEG